MAIVRQVLAAARFAHSHGIVHRDLKPHNVIVNDRGRAKVTDFGIARAGHSEITQTGSVMGTAQYLSPEQAQGLEVGPASDLYSIGVILYEALTGRVPFEADSAVAVALKQVSEPPLPPSRLNPAVPPALDAVVMKALAKDPANRFASATEFQRALDAAEVAPDSVVTPGDPTASATGRRGLEPVAVDSRRHCGAAHRRPRRVLADARGKVTVPMSSSRESPSSRPRPTLEDAGLHPEQEGVPNPATAGQVLETSPPAGTQVDEGSTVVITFSEGPGPGARPRRQRQTGRRGVGGGETRRVRGQDEDASRPTSTKASRSGPIPKPGRSSTKARR